jgi:hypothetical protein
MGTSPDGWIIAMNISGERNGRSKKAQPAMDEFPARDINDLLAKAPRVVGQGSF